MLDGTGSFARFRQSTLSPRAKVDSRAFSLGMSVIVFCGLVISDTAFSRLVPTSRLKCQSPPSGLQE